MAVQSPPDFSVYQAPGVYVYEDPSPPIAAFGVEPTVIGIVGPSVGYRTYTEEVTLNGIVAAQLTQLGIIPASVVVSAADGTVYAANIDYTLTAGAGADGQIGTTGDNTLTIVRVAAGAIGDGQQIFVSYHYQDNNYSQPRHFTNFADVQDAFGAPFDAAGNIQSPVSLAAQIAFQNGAREVAISPTADLDPTVTTRANLTAALNAIAADQTVNIFVLLPIGLTGTSVAPGDIVNVANDLVNFLVQRSDVEDLPCIGIYGYDRSATITPDVVAAGAPRDRLMLAWPNQMTFYNGRTNQSMTLSGYFLAAAYAGRLAANPVQTPLTRKQVFGFSGIPGPVYNLMTKSLKDNYASRGVAITEVGRNGRLQVRHGVSTDPSTLQTREISVTRGQDAMMELIRDSIEGSNLIGSAIEADSNAAVKGVIQGALETAKRLGIIVAYDNLLVRQASSDPSVMEAKFAYKPAWPLNYIVVAFSVDTSVGTVTTADNAATNPQTATNTGSNPAS